MGMQLIIDDHNLLTLEEEEVDCEIMEASTSISWLIDQYNAYSKDDDDFLLDIRKNKINFFQIFQIAYQ